MSIIREIVVELHIYFKRKCLKYKIAEYKFVRHNKKWFNELFLWTDSVPSWENTNRLTIFHYGQIAFWSQKMREKKTKWAHLECDAEIWTQTLLLLLFPKISIGETECREYDENKIFLNTHMVLIVSFWLKQFYAFVSVPGTWPKSKLVHIL